MLIAAILIGSYLLGSIPFGVIIVKAWKGVDIRQYGSRNIGATNAMRVVGSWQAFAVVLAVDALKGLIPVYVGRQVSPSNDWLAVACGLAAIVGHSTSVFLRFRGGKAVATSLGVIIGLTPPVAAIGFGLWLILVALTKYVSVGSIVTTLTILPLMFAFDYPLPVKIFGAVASIFVLLKHKSNISRLIQGKEPRIGQKVNLPEG
ncbi:MAG TPA: glycerol-3-phosphate 1-O-acyltransferase PlsY [Armatimonadota bacterium]|nr:glycerol-3-phosphate 1-O-acyltransferase PlsY [Armatimonadota bacterium]